MNRRATKRHAGTKSQRKLTLKQQRFAASLIGPANGNQTLAAKMAGYKGDNRQLAVQGSVNVRNPNVRKMVAEILDGMVEHGLQRLAEAMNATKMRSFLTREGEIIYAQPEPDHRIRLQGVDLMFRLRGNPLNSPAPASDQHGDLIQSPEDRGPSETQAEVARMDPADRMLFRNAGEIEEQLAQVDRLIAKDNGDGSSGQTED